VQDPEDLFNHVSDVTHNTTTGFGVRFRFQKYISQLVKDQKGDQLLVLKHCPQCNQIPDDPQVTDCCHIYCYDCLQGLISEETNGIMVCVECHLAIKEYYPNSNERSSSEDSFVASTRKRNGKGGSRLDWINLTGDILPSTKTTAIKIQVTKWLEEDPTAKIIIYTQFHQM
jgi:hypothetical protein